jgi:hypothetical protein
MFCGFKGTSPFSYAYCSNGKKISKGVLEDYSEAFVKSDSIAAYIVG